jgi:carboxyl-terminal processing protease
LRAAREAPFREAILSPTFSKRAGIAALLAVLFLAGWAIGWTRATAVDRYGDLDLFVDVFAKVHQFYVDPVEPKALVQSAIEGMLRDLDPFSSYLDERSFQDLQISTQGEFGGLGIVVSVRDRYPTVISPIEGTPAHGLGIVAGDVITEIEGESTRDLPIDQVVSRLRGSQGTAVRISIRREGETEDREYTIVREIIKLKSVPYTMLFDGNVGYVRLSNFSATSGDEVRSAIADLERRGARSLILDLRENPGGLLSEAVDVSEMFLERGAVIVETRGRARNADHTYTASEPRPHLGQPLVILISAGSASASEIVAGAVQDHDRGLVVGQTSFGKGSVQSLIDLPGTRAALKLTTAKYYTPAGRSIHRELDADEAEALAVEGDEATPDEAPAPPVRHPAAPDSARPTFRTDEGRIVYGGGGITPDVIVTPDTLGPVAREVRRRGLFFKFAVKHVARNGDHAEMLQVTPAVWEEFRRLLVAEGVEFTELEVAAERRWLELGMRQEVARRVGGDAAAFRVVSPEDKALQKALELLRKADGPRELLRLSALP